MPKLPDEYYDDRDPEDEHPPEFWRNETELLYGAQVPPSQAQEWDDLVPPEEKRDISRVYLKLNLELGQVPEFVLCPCLRIPEGAIYFHYCQQLADEKLAKERKTGCRFTVKPSITSAQSKARIFSGGLEEGCLNPEKFPGCRGILEAKKQGKL